MQCVKKHLNRYILLVFLAPILYLWIMVIEIDGNWEKGFALDLHTTKSTYLGVDEEGNKQFNNERSYIGELVYQLKYRSNTAVIPDIINYINRLMTGLNSLDYFIPVPPSKYRQVQPVSLITQALGQSLGITVLDNVISKNNPEQLKDIEESAKREALLRESLILAEGTNLTSKNILLVDDLYRSGATLRAITDILHNKANVSKVYILTMTKTRTNR